MTQSIIYRQTPQCERSLLEKAKGIAVSDLHEAMGALAGRAGLMQHTMRPVHEDAAIIGCAVTAYNYPGDNLMIHGALSVASEGQVLVLTNGGSPHGALWGEVAATHARNKGIAGVIVDGPVRDISGLRRLAVPVWSTFVSPSHPEKRGPGTVNMPVECAGVRVEPGDIVVADDDGVLVIPPSMLAEVVDVARARQEKEAALRARLETGEDLYAQDGMSTLFDSAGVEFRNGPWTDDR